MSSKLRISAVVSSLIIGLLTFAPGRAATPSSGTLDGSTSQVGWSGTLTLPQPTATPVGCTPAATDPANTLCDHYQLFVNLANGSPINVTVAVEEPDVMDIDLFVYAPNGIQMGVSATASGAETLIFNHNTTHYGSGPYDVRVQPWLVDPMTPYEGLARAAGSNELDLEGEDCIQLHPAVGQPFSVATTPEIRLSALVLLDGVSPTTGAAVFNRAKKSYEPLGINLSANFRGVNFIGNDAQELINQAKAMFDGKRPRRARLWADVVYVLTSKDIELVLVEGEDPDPGVAGLADCINGVRFDDNAFAVGEVLGGPFVLGPTALFVDMTAEVAAHEIGHLMGAHHHYDLANCAEGIPPYPMGEMPIEMDPCPLMANFVDFTSLNFGTLNKAVVRGAAEAWAAP